MLTVGLFCVLLASYRWGMRPGLVIAIFVAAPALLALNAGRLDLQLFTWVKVLTLAASMWFIAAYAWLRAEVWRRRLALCIIGFLVLNILEAVVADAVARHSVNALVGVSLIVTVARPQQVRSGADTPHLLYDVPWSWVLCYTLWNLTVVCGIYPEHWTDHFAVLAVPLAAALLWGRERWLEARAFSLSVYACGIVLAIDVYQLPWLPPAPSPAGLYPWLSGLAAVLAIWNLFSVLSGIRNSRLAR